MVVLVPLGLLALKDLLVFLVLRLAQLEILVLQAVQELQVRLLGHQVFRDPMGPMDKTHLFLAPLGHKVLNPSNCANLVRNFWKSWNG